MCAKNKSLTHPAAHSPRSYQRKSRIPGPFLETSSPRSTTWCLKKGKLLGGLGSGLDSWFRSRRSRAQDTFFGSFQHKQTRHSRDVVPESSKSIQFRKILLKKHSISCFFTRPYLNPHSPLLSTYNQALRARMYFECWHPGAGGNYE